MQIIQKKIAPEYYVSILLGNKKFEIRKEDDCQFNRGDIVILTEWEDGEYTGRFLIRRVDRVFRDLPGLEPGYCIFQLEDYRGKDEEKDGD